MSGMPLTDAELISRAQENPKYFDALYQKYAERIFNYFWYRVNHQTDVADDLTQEAFLRAFKALPSFREKGYSYGTYLQAIAHNLLINYYRLTQTVSLEMVDDIPEEISDQFEKKEQAQSVMRALYQLSPLERDIVLMKYQDDMKVVDIARITKKTENAVKLLLSRIRKKLSHHPLLAEVARLKRKELPHKYKTFFESRIDTKKQ